MNGASLEAQRYASNIKSGTGSAQTFATNQKAIQTSMNGTSVASKAASVGINIFKAALNTLIFFAVIEGIQLLVKGIDELILTAEEAEEKAESLRSSMQSFFDEVQSGQQTISSISDRFSELSEHVTETGENIDLTKDEYSEYLDICNQVKSIMPELVSGYTNEGNAIITLKDNVDSLTESYKENIRVKAAAFVTNGDEDGNTIQSFFDDYKIFTEGEGGLFAPSAGGLWNNKSTDYEDYYGYDKVHKWLSEVADLSLKDLQNLRTGTTQATYLYALLKENGYELADITEGNYEAVYDVLNTRLTSLEGEMSTRVSNVKMSLQQMLYADRDYWDIDNKEALSAIDSLFGSIDAEFIKQNNLLGQTALQSFESNVIKLFEDKNTQQAMIDIYTPQGQDESIKDYSKRVSDAIQKVQDYATNNKINVSLDFGDVTDDVETLQKQYDDAITKFGEESQDTLEKFFKDNSINDSSEIDYWNSITKGAKSAEEAVKMYNDAKKNGNKSGILSDIFSLKDAENTLTTLGKISESIDTIQNAYKTLNDAINEYNENGSFSVDTLQSVIALGDDWLDYLVDEEGNLKLDKEALEVLTKSRLEDMRVQTINNLIDNVSKINDDVSAKSYLESTNYAVAKSYEELTEKTLAYKRTALIDSGVSEDIADAVIEKAKSDIQKINELFENVDLSVESLTGGKGKSTSSTSKSSSDTIDWIETLLSRIQRTITNLGKTVSATYKGWSKRNNALAQEMKEINKEISAQATAYDTYMAKANSVPLSDEYKSLVHNGGFSFSEIKDEALKRNIDLYRQWYEKALNCSDAIEDLRSNLADLAKTKFDNVSKQYDNQMLMIDHNIQMLQGFVEQSESAGYMASEVYYQAMAEKQQENIAELQDKYGSLLSAFDEAVKNGSIEKYSEEWYNMLGDINDVEKELQSANTQLIEFNQTLQQLSWDVFDRVRDSISDINSEANFLIDIISRSDLFTDDGQITNEGLAVQGLYAVNYNTYMEQSLAYAEEIKRLNDEIAKDPYDLELIDRKNELIKAQQEAIANANSEKDAIRDLISNGYDKMLDSLDKLINKQKELLNSKKDLYDYENNITNQTKDIANLRKQLEAYKYDNSENAKATIQKLQVSLDEAEAELKETEYEKYISDQEQLLDKLYSDTEQWINERLDDID